MDWEELRNAPHPPASKQENSVNSHRCPVPHPFAFYLGEWVGDQCTQQSEPKAIGRTAGAPTIRRAFGRMGGRAMHSAIRAEGHWPHRRCPCPIRLFSGRMDGRPQISWRASAVWPHRRCRRCRRCRADTLNTTLIRGIRATFHPPSAINRGQCPCLNQMKRKLPTPACASKSA
jgi:hypothetical protein